MTNLQCIACTTVKQRDRGRSNNGRQVWTSRRGSDGICGLVKEIETEKRGRIGKCLCRGGLNSQAPTQLQQYACLSKKIMCHLSNRDTCYLLKIVASQTVTHYIDCIHKLVNRANQITIKPLTRQPSDGSMTSLNTF